MRLVLLYTVFAAIATLVNLLSQEITTQLYTGPYELYLAILAGTLAGLLVKYILDKRYIFAFQTQHIGGDLRLFFLYTLMGIVTTVIFWAFEWSFDYWFQSKTMRYTGAVIGLALGYYLKYRLDRRFVFVRIP